MAEPAWEVSIAQQRDVLTGWRASLTSGHPSREEARAAAGRALLAIEMHGELVAACKAALHAIEHLEADQKGLFPATMARLDAIVLNLHNLIIRAAP